MPDETPELKPEEKPAKKGRGPGRPFVKNDPRIPAVRDRMMGTSESPPEPDGVGEKTADEGVPQQLADMRWVYARPAQDDRTQGHKTCRRWMKADIKGFMAAKSQLEAKLLARRPPSKDDESGDREEPPAVVDKGSERARELLDRLLDDFHAEQAEEDAKLAARPDAAQIGATLQNTLKGALEREAMWKNQVEALRERVKELEHKGASSERQASFAEPRSS
jgi:polyhydroxyalkanoate synthesis regulator phasin